MDESRKMGLPSINKAFFMDGYVISDPKILKNSGKTFCAHSTPSILIGLRQMKLAIVRARAIQGSP